MQLVPMYEQPLVDILEDGKSRVKCMFEPGSPSKLEVMTYYGSYNKIKLQGY